MTDTDELVDRIRGRRWGWKRAFEAWQAVHGASPDITVHPDGTRVVERDAVEFITTRPGYLTSHAHLGYAGILQDDGTLQLDSEGVHRYQPIGDLPDGFTAYERITT